MDASACCDKEMICRVSRRSDTTERDPRTIDSAAKVNMKERIAPAPKAAVAIR